ncbi:MAG: ABC transporter permease subunit [Deltaproteobacteria bacterium]|nr:ABC transporter permease subunit [Deltaproteobacteria bacterium]
MLRRDILFKITMLLPLVVLTGYFLLLVSSQSVFFSLTDFLDQLGQQDIRSAIILSLVAATVSTAFAVILAIPAAYALARIDFPGKRLIDTFIDLPMVLTPIALGTLILMSWNSAIGRLLSDMGLTLPFTLAGVILAQFTVVVAISVRMLKATFEQIDPRQEQVARLLGCSAFESFRHITLPLARRGILAAIILTWARAIGEFGATVMVAGTARGQTATLPSSIYLAMSMADLPRAVTLVVILISISLLVLFSVRMVSEPRR